MDFGRLLLLFFLLFRSQQGALCVSHVFFLSTCPCFCTLSVSCGWSHWDALSLSWCQARVPHLRHGSGQRQLVALQMRLRGLWLGWRCSRGDWILRQEVTCQQSPVCVCMCVFGRTLRAFIPLVIVGMKKATWGGFYIVVCKRKYSFVESTIQLLWTQKVVVKISTIE